AYETTLRVPLIITEVDPRADVMVMTPRVSHYPARHVDIVPTVLDGVGLAIPATLRGRSLLSAGSLPPDRDVSSYFEAMSAMLNRGWAPLSGTLSGHEKYIDLPKAELYDLSEDPKEEHNLIDRRPDRRRVLEARLQDFHASPPGERF